MSTQAPRVGGRECPVREGTPEHCRRTVRPGHLMCGAHWRQVPKDVQTEVWRTWRGWERAATDDRWEAYMTARQAALDHFKTEDAATPSGGLTWPELDAAALVLVVAPDGSTRMWFGGDRDRAASVLQRVWTDLATRTEPAQDVHP